MKVNTVIQTVLTAEAGCYLTNGQAYGKTVILPAGEDASSWHEITQEAYDAIVKKQEETK